MLFGRAWVVTILSVASSTNVRLGFFDEPQPFELACARGWFNHPEHNVSCLLQSSGEIAAAALDDGDLHMAVLGSTPWVRAISRGVDLKMVYLTHQKGTSQGLVTKQEIRNPSELAGTRIATVFGTTAHYQMEFVVNLFHLDLELVLLSPGQILPAWNAGSIDGAFCWGQPYSTLLQQGFLMIAAETLASWGRLTFNAFVVSASFAAAQPEVVRHVVSVMATIDAAYLSPNSWEGSFIGPIADTILRNASNAQVLAGVSSELSTFVFVSRPEQLGCAYLGNASCVSLRGSAIDSEETSNFLYNQKQLPYRYAHGRWWPEVSSNLTVRDAFDQSINETFLAATENSNSLSALLVRSVHTYEASNPSGDSTCSGVVRLGPGNEGQVTGSVTDGAGGRAYTSYSEARHCTWVLTAASPTDLVEIEIGVMRLWTGDRLNLYSGNSTDSPPLAQLHGYDRSLSTFLAPGAMTIVLTTDHNREHSFDMRFGDGFSASYNAAATGCISDTQCLGGGSCVGGECHCVSGRSGATCANEWCTGRTTMTANSGSVRSSPHSLLQHELYLNDAYCEFVVRPADAAYVRFNITFDVETASDSVLVCTGAPGITGHICPSMIDGVGNKVVTVATLNGAASLIFETDRQGRRSGFIATYDDTPNICSADAHCSYRGSCVSGSCICDVGWNGLACSSPYCERFVSDRGTNVNSVGTAVQGNFASQRPGISVGANLDCTWSLDASSSPAVPLLGGLTARVGLRVVLETFSLESNLPNDDYLQISWEDTGQSVVFRTDGCSAGSLCLQEYHTGACLNGVCEVRRVIEAASSRATLRLHTDSNDQGLFFSGVAGSWYSLHECPTSSNSCQDSGGACSSAGECFLVGVAVNCSCALDASSARLNVVRLGMLLPMFGTEDSVRALAWSPRLGVYQALRELNNKTDSVADELLPTTQLHFAFRDAKCDGQQGLTGALELVQSAFGGEGVDAIIGAGCSGASTTASQVAGASRTPIISPSSTSPTLSDGRAYPYFTRVIPSEAFATVAMVDTLRELWGYTSVALVHSTDAYGAGGGTSFAEAADVGGVNILTTQRFAQNTLDFSSRQRALQRSGARVIVLYCLEEDGSRFLRTAYEGGVGGEGFLWLGGNGFVSSGLWESDARLASNVALRERVLRGFFSVTNTVPPSSLYDGYLARRRQLPSTTGDGISCDLETDDDDAYLWAQRDENNASAPLRCAGFDTAQDGPFDAFGYDAVFAVAHALHDLIEVQNRTEIVGSELLDTLITRVSFEGVTGLVDLHDASTDPDRLYQGDRRVGNTFALLNYVDSTLGLVEVGAWTPCAALASCGWADRWVQAAGVALTYSTVDNSRPRQQGSCSFGAVVSHEGGCVCDDGFELDPQGQHCRRCEPGQYSLRATRNASASGGCTLCAEHYFRETAHLPASACKSCGVVTGASCPVNVTSESLFLEAGMWRHSSATLETWRCERIGDWTPCRGGDDAGTDGDGYCSDGYRGPRCELCNRTGFAQYFSKRDARCHDCGDITSYMVVLFLVPPVLLFVAVALCQTATHSQAGGSRVREWLLSTWQRISRIWYRASMRFKLKMFVGWWQCMSAIPKVFGATLPRALQRYSGLLSLLELPSQLGLDVFSSACLGSYRSQLLLVSLLPVASFFLYAAMQVASDLLNEHAKERRSSFRDTVQQGLIQGTLPVILAATFVLVPSTATLIFETFLCDHFEYDSANQEERRCRRRGTAIVLLLVWPVGVPLLYTVLLWKSRRALSSHIPTPLSRATAFLSGDYKSDIYWWEPLEMCRKLTLTGWVLLIGSGHEQARVLVALLVSIFFLFLTVSFQPARRGADASLLLLVEFGCVVVYFTLLVLKSCDTSPAVCATYGFGETGNGVFLLFLFFGLGVLLVLLLLAVLELRQIIKLENRMQPILVKLTGSPPELSLHEDHLYHMFNSHCWSTAQDAAATIKRNLQLLIPNVRVFLDVDNMKDVGDLEKYVAESAVVLLFLSAGYFKSKACLREVHFALEKAKPSFFVHEADPERGGGALAQLQLELQDEPLRRVLFEERRTISWFRVAELQQVSMLSIAEEMLRSSPRYRDEEMPRLFVRGSLLEQRLVFPTQVVLALSQNNPGADMVAAEIQSSFRTVKTTHRLPERTRKTAFLGRFQQVVRMSVRRSIDHGTSAVTTVSDGEEATHFLLYLCDKTYVGAEGEALKHEIHGVLDAGLPVVLVHELDEARGGVPFATFFQTTELDLIDRGVYSTLAMPFVSGQGHRRVGHAMLAKALGAQPAQRVRISHFSLPSLEELSGSTRNTMAMVATSSSRVTAELRKASLPNLRRTSSSIQLRKSGPERGKLSTAMHATEVGTGSASGDSVVERQIGHV